MVKKNAVFDPCKQYIYQKFKWEFIVKSDTVKAFYVMKLWGWI